MTVLVSALFDDRESAGTAIDDLLDAGVAQEDVTIVSPQGPSDGTDGAEHQARDAAADAETGAGLGAALGGVGGLLAGLGVVAVPGLGPVVAAGWLASTLAGAAAGVVAGSVTGGVLGALMHAGVPEREAHAYAEGIRRGATWVSARVSEAGAEEVHDILHRNGAIDLTARTEAWRLDGWSGPAGGASTGAGPA